MMFVLICHFLVFLCGCFFFFKQKTAYEMRISDWSSDVCSSDLPDTKVVDADCSLIVLYRPRRVCPLGYASSDVIYWRFVMFPTPNVADSGAQLSIAQIGSASCRERVCQYV